MKRLRVLLTAVALLPAMEAATISGRVYDPSGAVVPAAGVTLIGAATGVRQTANTPDTGEFSFTGLAAGDYRMEVAKPGFVLFTRNLRVTDQKDARVMALLKVGQIVETIEVTAAGSPVPKPVKTRVGGHLQPARLLHAPRVVYPEAAKGAGTEGSVVVQTVILRDGSVGDARAFAGTDPELAKAAVETVRQWKYSPTVLNGNPVETVATVEVNFRLER